ncbi:uncharacterized protein LOC113523624 isoform X2 [Galleria mellonella]|uniref:Uncharacterized protein LOC113523624 isoform X2 n=1 Tax=Galleria mellonella TaxID=7137 RepID=A0A6J3BU22_GALME|nr:uncharacterized protein LOC113523624 isoform X2 [Galleria mellonella]
MKSVAMYATSTASTTSGSGRAACVPAAERRVRVVRLLRPRRAAPAFGFSLRGGREYATGFFVSKIEFNSEAHLQGLKVGDQLVSVNGYRVDDAVHAELVHYLASQSRLKIKVRHVGMVPVKEKAHEALSWQFVSERASLASDVSSSPTLCHDTARLTDLRLSILVPPRSKLGCGICKGPEWKPGIFVQFVREGGIAREAGLRPGDQIISCNGQDFANISFNEAISAMKATGRLELVIREGAGTELVSPESSGYNSSASSAAGERSPAPPAPVIPLAPPAALRRRLASVAEEAADRADRLTMNRLKRRTWDSLDFEWKNGDIHNFDAPSDIEPDYDSPSIPNNPHTYENKNIRCKNKDFITSPSNRTIINLTEDGATIQCSYDNQSPRKGTFTGSHLNRDNEKKTIVVEVHHTSTAACGKSHCNYPSPPKKDISDSSSVSSSNTLSSAIAEEIQKRKLNKKNSSNVLENEVSACIVKKANVPKTIDNDQKKQHDALMDEFKKVHRKMFANQENSSNEKNNNGGEANNLDRQQTLPLRKVENAASVGDTNNHTQLKQESTDVPPPPPPMPITNGQQKVELNDSNKEKAATKSANVDHNKFSNIRKNGTLTRTPTPDYNKSDSVVPTKLNNKDEKADIESLESYKLKNPSNVQPKPPSNYFVRAPNGTATMNKHGRPVSVTIGEYAGSTNGRREPTKLDFLNGDRPDGIVVDDDTSISNRLQSELALTLSRSNLRKKTEALDHLGRKRNIFLSKDSDTKEDSDSSLDKNFHVRYGNNLLPLPPSISIPKVVKLKY